MEIQTSGKEFDKDIQKSGKYTQTSDTESDMESATDTPVRVTLADIEHICEDLSNENIASDLDHDPYTIVLLSFAKRFQAFLNIIAAFGTLNAPSIDLYIFGGVPRRILSERSCEDADIDMYIDYNDLSANCNYAYVFSLFRDDAYVVESTELKVNEKYDKDHIRMKVSFKKDDTFLHIFGVDILLKKPPSTNIDFDVNALEMKVDTLQTIRDRRTNEPPSLGLLMHIKKNTAFAIEYKFPKSRSFSKNKKILRIISRCQKMVDNGWTLYGAYHTHSMTSDERCSICHSEKSDYNDLSKIEDFYGLHHDAKTLLCFVPTCHETHIVCMNCTIKSLEHNQRTNDNKCPICMLPWEFVMGT